LPEKAEMRIAYLSALAPPDQPAISGVLKVSETLLRQFEIFPGLQVEAIALVDGLKSEITRQRGNVRYHYLPCRPQGKTATFYWFEKRRLQQLVRGLRVDLAHGQPTGEYLLAATSCGLPHVITIHGLVLRETAGLSLFHSGRLAGWVREKMQRRAARRAANIISISPYVNEYLRGWTRGQIHPVANPIDPEFFEIPPPEHGGLRILCVGIVSERKNQALLIRACHLLKQSGLAFECRIVGKFSPGAEKKMNQLIGELGLTEHAVLRGPISRESLLAEYEWSNVVALPSREETSPLSLIQAMACGRCVFGADAAGIPKLLQPGGYGTLFPAESPEALALELRQLVTDPASYWELARNAKNFADSTFKPETVARRTFDVYTEILRSVKNG
jgi:glycosyltransferase involved in cell wall biosynthesis